MLPLLGIILIHQNGLKWWRTDQKCHIRQVQRGMSTDRWNVGHIRTLRVTTIESEEKNYPATRNALSFNLLQGHQERVRYAAVSWSLQFAYAAGNPTL